MPPEIAAVFRALATLEGISPRGIRINCISPAVLAESTAYHRHFPGFVPVPARDVALAHLRSISNPYNGKIVRLHRVG